VDLKTWLRAQWDRVLGAGAVLTGIVAILLGYRGVSRTPFPAEQVPYVISGAVIGIALIGIGLTSWLSADLRDEWRKLDRLERLLGARETDGASEPAAAPAVDDHAETPPRSSLDVDVAQRRPDAQRTAPDKSGEPGGRPESPGAPAAPAAQDRTAPAAGEHAGDDGNGVAHRLTTPGTPW
jgi:hypothetical protein